MMVDEVQLASIDILSVILSRPTRSGKLILMGDIKQTYNIIKPSESGLLKLLRILPHKSMAYVELQNSYRSELVELASKLQDKVFI
jgi:predicted ribonuclease YlaK